MLFIRRAERNYKKVQSWQMNPNIAGNNLVAHSWCLGIWMIGKSEAGSWEKMGVKQLYHSAEGRKASGCYDIT